MRELLRLKQEETWTKVKAILALEQNPYTQNGHYIQVTKDKHLAIYKAARAEAAQRPQRPKRAKRQTKAQSLDVPGKRHVRQGC